jgi:membrane protease YdiL (CAAX protease family)
MAALRSLGFGRPATLGLNVTMGLGLLLLATIPVYAVLRGASLAATPGWMWFLPGLFAQGGVAEEALFRGYPFRHLRRDKPFWRAAGLAAVPFALVHLYLFATLPWPIALASILLATVISFPLAHLFELGGNTIWPPALLHFIVQGAVKVLAVPGDTAMPLVWIAASAALPYLAFLYRRPSITAAPA